MSVRPAERSPADERAVAPSVPGPGRVLRGLRADGAALTLAEHLRVHGPLIDHGGHRRGEHAVVGLAEAAGLRGRGGGGFPLADKLRTVVGAAGHTRRPVVVVNAAESEPASRKDAVLLTRTPHLVLDGAALAAAAVGARDVVVWLHRGDVAGARAARAAVGERAATGVLGVRHRVVEGPPRYVAGEASAIAAHLSGGPARPRVTPPRVAQRGVHGRPTLVSNAETLAHLALVARHGPGWFRALGTPEEPGTTLVTVLGAVGVPGVVEVPVGTPLGAVLAPTGGPPPVGGAVLVGGYAGTWLPADRALPLPWSQAGLAAAGGTPGVGLVAVLPADACPVAETARLVGWLAGEGAQQCGPCLNGLPALAGACRALAAGPASDAAAAPGLLHRWAGMVEGRGACHHPDGVAGLVRSLLAAFPDEVARHAAGRPCPAAAVTATRSVLPLPPPEPGGPAWR
ncbi:MAG: proton-conducting membrane transporter [Actinomycetia bacterium]|nr:proton-conducting membrane transporter [Actinomycetes bacterium]